MVNIPEKITNLNSFIDGSISYKYIYRTTLESYHSELRKLAMTLLRLLGKAINMDVKEVEEVFEDGMQSIRMSYYPPCPQPDLVVGITPHSDATGITILNQVNGVEGLEIKKDGVWIPVTFHPDAFVVNVGDIMEVCHTFTSSLFPELDK